MSILKRFFSFLKFKFFNRKPKINLSELRDLVYVTNFLEEHPRSTFDLYHKAFFTSEENNV